ncbi:MAG: DUF1587 domain-containing protein [Planctomycetes bacterium]|nr:DUF1587 domain-containing protein [Planctomycetota bacterium]
MISIEPCPHFFSKAHEFLKSHYFKCHDSSKQKRKFRLDNLSTDFADPQVAQKWNEVVFRLNAGEMPPEKEPRPRAKEIGRTVEVIIRKIREGAAARMARRGLVEHYRLSRQEYAHTVYDLPGVVFDVEAPGAFNEDPRWHGHYRIRIRVSGLPAFTGRAPRLSLWHHQLKKSLAEVEWATSDEKPETIELEGLFLAAGIRLRNRALCKVHCRRTGSGRIVPISL